MLLHFLKADFERCWMGALKATNMGVNMQPKQLATGHVAVFVGGIKMLYCFFPVKLLLAMAARLTTRDLRHSNSNWD